MPDYELRAAIGRWALESLEAGALLVGGSPDGVTPLDLWSNGRYGSVLVWVDRELDISDFGHALLVHHNATRLQDGNWSSTGSGGMGCQEREQILAGLPSALHRLGGGSQDPMRVTIGIASPDVAAIRLRDTNAARQRAPGVDGFFVLGITHQDPITYASALDSEGQGDPRRAAAALSCPTTTTAASPARTAYASSTRRPVSSVRTFSAAAGLGPCSMSVGLRTRCPCS
jgi:hypothetical protein